jgi:type VI secretion system protein ImpM
MIANKYLMSKPAIWGKLPTHADYISHGVQAGQTQAWQLWLEAHAPGYVVSRLDRERQGVQADALGYRRWSNLDVPAIKAREPNIPVAFMLPPGTLAFSAARYVVGVILPSHDAIGRSHPVIAYSLANHDWLDNYWNQLLHEAQDWQFWLGRWMAQVQESANAVPPEQEDDARRAASVPAMLFQGLDSLWQLHSPHWLNLFTNLSTRPSAQENANIMALTRQAFGFDPQEPLSQTFSPEPSEQPALHGVSHMPWADWPARILDRRRKACAFWQQDNEGRYIGAAETLSQFNRAR